MTGFFDKLGLSSQERRLVVIVGIVVFIVINWWVIIPRFGDWGRFEQRISDKKKEKVKFETEIHRESEYRNKLRGLQQQSGTQVASEAAALRLQQEVMGQANLTGLGYGTVTPVNRGTTTTGKTNSFFDEASVNVTISTGEKELIDFLVRLADKELLIRAKSMDIGPDPSQMRLQGNLTLVKSFQRKPPTKSASASTPAIANAQAVATPPATTPSNRPPTTPTAASARTTNAPPATTTTTPTPTRTAPTTLQTPVPTRTPGATSGAPAREFVPGTTIPKPRIPAAPGGGSIPARTNAVPPRSLPQPLK